MMQRKGEDRETYLKRCREYDRRRYFRNTSGRKDWKKEYAQKPEQREYSRKYHQELRNGPRRDEILQNKRDSYTLHRYEPRTIAQITNSMISSARSSAKRNSLEFNLSKPFIRQLLESCDICPVFGMKLDVSGIRGREDRAPSLDRLDSKRGYTEDNVRLISWRANRLKGNGTLEEFKKIIKWMED